ncbi:YdeI/OmpD-associated family protein [Chitinophagaceae bacterium LWZ2-11]
MFEKLQLKDEKTLLIQGIPSSIEKQFAKLAYAKNVTPLLKSKKVDFALVFAINQNQLNNVLKEVFPALHCDSKLWVAYPKPTSKIVSDLNRDCTWDYLTQNEYEGITLVAIDHVWSAMRFKKCEISMKAKLCEEVVAEIELEIEDEEVVSVESESTKVEKKKGADFEKKLVVVPPVELEKIFTKHKKAKDFFSSLPATNQKEYVSWIEGAKKEETRQRRLDAVVEKLIAGKKNPTEK